MIQCNKKGCSSKARHSVRIALRPNKNTFPSKSEPIFHVCDKHTEGLTWEGLVSDETWMILCERFVVHGFAAPKVEHCYLIVEPL